MAAPTIKASRIRGSLTSKITARIRVSWAEAAELPPGNPWRIHRLMEIPSGPPGGPQNNATSRTGMGSKTKKSCL